jgi:F-type H+-transporting ATPase subunit b
MATETNEAAEAAAPGMPQLDFSTFPNQIFWLVVTLVIIYFVLSRIALPRIAAVLAERQGTITNDIAAAEELKLKALEAEQAYEQALADARAESAKIASEARAEIKAGLDDAIAKADAEIAARASESEARIAEIQSRAMEDIGTVARDTAAAIVAAIAPGTAEETAINNTVDAKLKGAN